MRDSLLHYISDKRISGALADYLRNLSERDADVIERIVQGLNPSANALRVLLDSAKEISKRDSISLADVFQACDLDGVVARKLGRKEKLALLGNTVKYMRYPEFGKLKKELDEALADVFRNFGVSLRLPKDLEGEDVRVSFNVRTPEDVLEFSLRLRKLSEDERLTLVFSLLHGHPRRAN